MKEVFSAEDECMDILNFDSSNHLLLLFIFFLLHELSLSWLLVYADGAKSTKDTDDDDNDGDDDDDDDDGGGGSGSGLGVDTHLRCIEARFARFSEQVHYID